MARSTGNLVLFYATVLASQLASLSAIRTEGGEPVKCEYKGPIHSDIVRTFEASNCNDCRATLFDGSKRRDRLELPFQNKFVPTYIDATKSGQDICACNVRVVSAEVPSFETKVVIQLRKKTCRPDSVRAQEACWSVYQSLAGFSQVNAWKHDLDNVGCLPCVLQGECDVTDMPQNMNADAIGRLQKLAQTDDDAAERLKFAQRWGVLKEDYIWMPAEWSPCSQPCKDDDASVGTRTRASKCVLKGDVDRTFAPALCEAHVGAAPTRVPEECNTHFCKKYERKATDDWDACSKPCRDADGPGIQKRRFDCMERQADGQWILVAEGLCVDLDTPMSDEPRDKAERFCNVEACSAWALEVHCKDIDGANLGDEECEDSLTKPSLEAFMQMDIDKDGRLSPDELYANWPAVD